jgi:S1-C subfamily serine protease
MLSMLLLTFQALTAAQKVRETPESRVAAQVAPSVVYIESVQPMLMDFTRFGAPVYADQVTSGSGVVIEKSGYIVTNYHVVGNSSKSITVQFSDEVDPKHYDAELVSAVPKDDLALLKISGNREFPEVRRGTSSDLMLGERVVAIGNPLQQKLTVSTGIISGLHRDLPVVEGAGMPNLRLVDLIQTDAAINRGNSGGPLLNILGEMIGINSAVNPGAENMGFAIPVDRVEAVLRDQLLAPSSSRAWLGFEVDDTASMCITRVTPDGPAAQAGVDIGYRLLAIDDHPIKTPQDYRLLRLPILPYQPVKLRVASATGERTVELRGWDRPDGITFERMGITVQNFAYDQYRFVRVEKTSESGPAVATGLKRGDVIAALRVKPNGQSWSTASPDDLATLISSQPSGAHLELEVLRDEDGDRRWELYKGDLVLR